MKALPLWEGLSSSDVVDRFQPKSKVSSLPTEFCNTSMEARRPLRSHALQEHVWAFKSTTNYLPL
ncbi:hypothetical protein GBA52_026037 [Prunus armeniaca]|nr:hypothetical protein GBA52_026037 [Prunus armeniaca]